MPKSKVVFSTEQHEQSKVDHFMAFTRAQHKAHHAAMLNTLQHFDPHTGVVTMGANGTMAGPKGMKGGPGVAGALYVIEPVEGHPLIMNSTPESLQKEYEEWENSQS
ncbi:hypothetical protein EXT67_21530 [Pectobacterium atrosepticum]|uniref:Uncharacterized protein n=1 Tax=Pectobacterium phage phiTE TaxID=1116482 RepID=K9L4A8_9CAUD|nr:hypothetical protein [Pectobacterium atrosepticum]YP_007392584.1 hypothetical protein phiTE_122 [Pectobacterium phage phiTE]AEZ66288.1 hypothetical protein phiTE_122 [Pectobacterium phage phiTE]ARB11725.1 hypothetical protein CB7_167 [Pectobacterium phage vB_PatM_CB7]MCL6318871.1 hypothetical protein [Pectobacterium atrosepticum]